MKKIITFFSIIIALILIVDICLFINKNADKNDRFKFAKEYEITEDNIFVYRNAKEAAKILEDGTGVIFFGFSECAWCKAYVPMLNEAAIQIGLDKIYYVDIKKDREKNTKAYQEIIYYLNSNLLNDEEGNKRIYVPNLTIVVDGIVVGNNNLTSMEVGDPKEYWTEKRQNNFKTNIKNLLKPYVTETCYMCR